jgi:hypothetical protein
MSAVSVVGTGRRRAQADVPVVAPDKAGRRPAELAVERHAGTVPGRDRGGLQVPISVRRDARKYGNTTQVEPLAVDTIYSESLIADSIAEACVSVMRELGLFSGLDIAVTTPGSVYRELTLGAILRAAEQKGKAGVVMEFLVALAELSEAVHAQAVQIFTPCAQILTDRENFMDCLQHLESCEAARGRNRAADRKNKEEHAAALHDYMYSVVHFTGNIDAAGCAEALVFDRVHTASGRNSVRQALLATFVFPFPRGSLWGDDAVGQGYNLRRRARCHRPRGLCPYIFRDVEQPCCRGPRQLDRFDLSCLPLKDAATGARTAAHYPTTGSGFGYCIYESACLTEKPQLDKDTRRVRDSALASIVSTIYLSRVVQSCYDERTSRTDSEKRQPRRKESRGIKPRRVSQDGDEDGAVTRDMSVLSALVRDLLTVLNLLAVHRFRFDSLRDVVGPWLGLSLFCSTFADHGPTSSFVTWSRCRRLSLFWLAVLYIVVRLTLADSRAVLLAYYASLRLFSCSYFHIYITVGSRAAKFARAQE